MTDPFRLYFRPIELEVRPRWATHYIQTIEIVDISTGKTADTVTGFDRDGREAVKQARQLALEVIRRLSQKEEGESGSGCSAPHDESSKPFQVS